MSLALELMELAEKTRNYKPSWIVCAANFYREEGTLVLGARHFDMIMHNIIDDLPANVLPSKHSEWEQGFVDQYGNFLSREAAFVIATRNGQIKKKSGNPDSKQLFSEDLY